MQWSIAQVRWVCPQFSREWLTLTLLPHALVL